jgi:hypothetical protein
METVKSNKTESREACIDKEAGCISTGCISTCRKKVLLLPGKNKNK